MTSHAQDIVCLVLMSLTPILSAILLFNQLKFNNNATQKRKSKAEKVLHRKSRRNPTVEPFTNKEINEQ